jgi:hypothetical protein
LEQGSAHSYSTIAALFPFVIRRHLCKHFGTDGITQGLELVVAWGTAGHIQNVGCCRSVGKSSIR